MNYGIRSVQGTPRSNRIAASTYMTIDTMTISRSAGFVHPLILLSRRKETKKWSLKRIFPPIYSPRYHHRGRDRRIKFIKNSEFDIVNQLHKTPFKISLLALIYYSKAHRDVLSKIWRNPMFRRRCQYLNLRNLLVTFKRPSIYHFLTRTRPRWSWTHQAIKHHYEIQRL